MQGVYVLARLHHKRNSGLFAVIGLCFTFVLLSHMPGHGYLTICMVAVAWRADNQLCSCCVSFTLTPLHRDLKASFRCDLSGLDKIRNARRIQHVISSSMLPSISIAVVCLLGSIELKVNFI